MHAPCEVHEKETDGHGTLGLPGEVQDARPLCDHRPDCTYMQRGSFDLNMQQTASEYGELVGAALQQRVLVHSYSQI
jgi:hypothetical protein